jgi:hypothetical protein
MQCENVKRLISDNLDAALQGTAKARLEAHLTGCAPCRDYRASLAKLQTGCLAIAPRSPEPEKMVQSMAKLKASLRLAVKDGIKPGSKPVRAPYAKPVWGWAAASAALLVAFAGLYLIVLRPGPAIDIVPYAFSEAHSDIVLTVSGDDSLIAAFDTAIQASLGEGGTASVTNVEPLAGDAGRFLDSLTDDEVLLLEAALQEIIAL